MLGVLAKTLSHYQPQEQSVIFVQSDAEAAMVGILFLILVVFFSRLQEQHLRKSIGYNEDVFTIWALHVFAPGVPRNGACDVHSALAGFDCYGVS